MFTELEYKYNANEIRLDKFRQLIQSLGVRKHIEIASWDIYYTKPGEVDTFHRLRNGPTPELTKKIKLSSTNNFQRVEIDLPLDPIRMNTETVAKYMELQGYQENFRIFKYCDIYVLDRINYVYYCVYGDNLQELGRFIEVEVNKSEYNEVLAITMIRDGEKKLEQLGLVPQHRLRKSLFELYRK